MARTTAPLFSMDASGTIAGAIVFSRWRGRNYVRRHAIPSNPRTGLQSAVRSSFRFLTQYWGTFTPPQAGLWDDVGDVTKVTGLNAFVAENVRRIREGRPFIFDPTDEGITPCDNPDTFVATPLARAISLEWTYDSPVAPPWGTLIYMREGAAPAGAFAFQIAASPAAAVQLIVTGLTPSVTYNFELATFGFANYLNPNSLIDDAQPIA